MNYPDGAEFYIKEKNKIVFYKEVICPNLRIKLLDYFEDNEWKVKCRGYIPWGDLIPIHPVLNYEI